MRLVVLDPALVNKFGHHYNMDSRLRREALRRGLGCRILGHAGMDAATRDELDAVALFRRSTYAKPADRDESFQRLNNDTLADLRRLHPEHLSPQDLFLIHSIDQDLLAGLLAWHAGIPRERRPWLVSFSHDTLPFDDAEAFRRKAGWYRIARGQIRDDTERFRMVVCDHRHAQAYSDITGWPVTPVAMPFFDDTAPADRPWAGGTVRIGFLGSFFLRKGGGLLAGAADHLLRQRPGRAHLVIHVGNPMDIPEAREAVLQLRALAAAGAGLDLIEGTMSEADYNRLLDGCDAVALPYDPAVYRYKTSAVLAEAFAAGKPVVVAAATWLAEQAEQAGAGHTVFDSMTAGALGDALVRLVDDFPAHKHRASLLAPDWRRRHGVTAFLDTVLAWAEQPALSAAT